MKTFCEKSTDSVPAARALDMKKVVIRKPAVSSDEFALKGQSKDAACSFSPYM